MVVTSEVQSPRVFQCTSKTDYFGDRLYTFAEVHGPWKLKLHEEGLISVISGQECQLQIDDNITPMVLQQHQYIVKMQSNLVEKTIDVQNFRVHHQMLS